MNAKNSKYQIKLVDITKRFEEVIAVNCKKWVSHHWAVVNGDVREELNYLADMIGIRKVAIY